MGYFEGSIFTIDQQEVMMSSKFVAEKSMDNHPHRLVHESCLILAITRRSFSGSHYPQLIFATISLKILLGLSWNAILASQGYTEYDSWSHAVDEEARLGTLYISNITLTAPSSSSRCTAFSDKHAQNNDYPSNLH